MHCKISGDIYESPFPIPLDRQTSGLACCEALARSARTRGDTRAREDHEQMLQALRYAK